MLDNMNENNDMNKKSTNLKLGGSSKTGIKSIVLIALLSLFSCAEQPSWQSLSSQGSCANIDVELTTSLTKQLASVADKMQMQTGVYVLEQGTEAMLSRAWLSQYAEQSIDVQYFIFSADNIGLIAIDYLVRAADRGVQVRILVDDIMVDAKGDELLTLAAHANIDIKIYNPMANVGKNIVDKLINITTDFHQLNQRMHNKSFTIDSKLTITGGRNVADEYFGYDHEYNFRDRDVLLLGGVTRDVQHSFNQFWQHPLSVDVTQLVQGKNALISDFRKLHQYACDPLNFTPQIRNQIADIPYQFTHIQQSGQLRWLDDVQYVADLPGKNDGSKFLGGSGVATDKLIELLQQAQHSVTIQTPYLITTDVGKKVFKSLTDKGVMVKILTNSMASNDNLEAFSGYQRDRKALLNTGVEIYEFKPDAKIRQKVMSEAMHNRLEQAPIFGLHAKSMVIDDAITVIGTFNLDPRSANLNTESVTIIPSASISAQVKQGMLEEMLPENAWRTTHDWNPDGEVSLLKRVRVKLRRVVPKNIL